MIHRSIPYSILTITMIAAFAALTFNTFVPEPAEAQVCGPCTGPLRSVAGSGTSLNSNQAYSQAYQDALGKISPVCSPCQINVTNVSTAVIWRFCVPVPCPGPEYAVSLTLSYRCECRPEGPATPD